jgi:hypothetical protein
MTTNSFNNAVKVLEYAADCIENNLGLARMVGNKYDPYFREDGAKHGDTINLRVPALGYNVRTGPAAQPQGYTDTMVPLQVQQYGADMEFTSSQLRLNLEDGEAFQQNVLNPLLAPVANKIDTLLWDKVKGISASVGTPGTKPSNIDTLLDAGALLDMNGVPRDGSWAGVLHPRHQASMLKGTTSYFNPQADIAEQYRNGRLGRLVGGYKMDYDQNAISHTVGTFGTSTPAMNGSTADGAVQIVTNGWASGASALKVGDQISIAGVYSVNPVSKSSTGELKLFTVTEDATDTTGGMTIKISPAITVAGPNQNVTAVPLTTAAVYVWGKQDYTYSGKVSATSVLFHPDAFALATVDLALPQGGTVFAKRIRSKQLGIPMRLIQWYNGNSDSSLFRLDILAGAALQRENFAARIVG